MSAPSDDLGQPRLVLNVADLANSVDFYERLGFERHEPEHWTAQFASMRTRGFVLDLMQGVFLQPALLHLMADTQAEVDARVERLATRGLTARRLGPGNRGAQLEDPDGNAVYLSVP